MAITTNTNSTGRGFSGVPRAAQSLDALLQQSSDKFGGTPPPVVPAAQAVPEGVGLYSPQRVDVPPLPSTGITGAIEAPTITAESPVEDLAQASQSSLAARPRSEPVLGPDGMPVFDEATGQYATKPITMDQYGQQQQEDLRAVPDFTEAFTNTDDPYQFSKKVLEAQNKVTPTFDDSQIKSWANNAADALNNVSVVTEDALFNVGSTRGISSMAPGFEGVPVGLKVLHDEGIPMEYAAPLSTLLGVAHALSAGQTMSYNNKDVRTSSSDPRFDGETAREEDLINSVLHYFSNSLDKTGYKMSPESVRSLAEAKVKSAIYRGEHKAIKDKNGRWAYASNDRLKSDARDLKYLTEALAGDMGRSPPAKVPRIAGGTFIRPGSQKSRNSMSVPGSTETVAEVVKDMFGSIAEFFEPTAVISTTKQLKDIQAKMVDDETGYYSTSKFAKRHKVDHSSYKKLMDRVQPPRDYKGTDTDKSNLAAAKRKHAREEIDQKLHMLEYDLGNAKSMQGMLYTGYIHSLTNQRFFRNSLGTDILASKGGVREMLNFGLQAMVQPFALFGEGSADTIRNLQQRATPIFKAKGVARQKALLEMTPSDRAMLGLMECAVINYYSFSGDSSVHNPSITKFGEVDIINKYTPEIGNHLASLGREYNDWLMDDGQSGKDFSNIENLLAKMPRGEAQGFQNLWNDMYQLQKKAGDPAAKNSHHRLTALNYDDGNQNGIFLQAIYSGSSKIANRLGSATPNLEDMRGYALNDITQQLEGLLKDSPDKLIAWKNFFAKAMEANPDDLASDMFKAALMQYAYGKDASMFGDHLIDFFDDDTYGNIASQELVGVDNEYTDIYAAVNDLSKALESTLRKVVDPTFVSMLKRLGRMFAIMDTVPVITGTAQDSWIFGSVDVGFTPDVVKDFMWQAEDQEGNLVQMKKRGAVTTPYMTPEGVVESPEAKRRLNASAAKPTQYFFNKRTGEFDTFENPLGSALSRLLGVMPIQSTDGDLLKLMMLAVNSGRSIPLPVATVHDSLITSMDSMHLYRNAYNNIAIPQAVPEIKKFANRLQDAYKQARSDMLAKTKLDNYIGIGAEGDFPSLGALFDELQKKITGESYKQHYIKSYCKPGDTKPWENYVAKIQETLNEAKKHGWRYDSPMIAVKGDQFEKLFKIAESHLSVGGADNKFDAWAKDFPHQVQIGFDDFMANNNVRKHGIYQMNH
jgi:hypothetical protein